MTEKPPAPTAPFIPEDVAYFSASGVQLNSARWTLQLIVVSPMSVASGQDRAEAVVSMPWTLAKALYLGLGETLKAYEAAEGEIALPKSYTTAMAEALAESEGAEPKPNG